MEDVQHFRFDSAIVPIQMRSCPKRSPTTKSKKETKEEEEQGSDC
jgi:hypothetical protein